MRSTLRHIRHLHNRAGFGLTAAGLGQVSNQSVVAEAERLCKKAVEEKPILILDEALLKKYSDQRNMIRGESLKQLVRKEVKASRERIPDLNVQWMDQMIDPQSVVREKLTLFWHDHFSVRNSAGHYIQKHNNTLRRHALGKYGDLLLAVAKDPAMLLFLNNQQNRKRRPNENFARELLELYTLGRGHYSEQDIKHAARAFTGWSFDQFTSEYHFRRRFHDFGDKDFMGHKGNLNGDDIVNIVLSNEQTGRFLARKLFQFYVSDTPHEDIISSLGARLYKTDYDIGDLLGYMFAADWFYEDRFVNNKIKSPIELINNLRVHLGVTFEQPKALIYLERVLGQVLFFPSNVNGWPLGRGWIDSSSLINRMRLPAAMAKGSLLGMGPRDDGDNSPMNLTGEALLRAVSLNLDGFDLLTKGEVTDSELVTTYAEFLLNQELPVSTQAAISQELKRQKDKNKRPWLVTTLAGLPEYQLS